MSTIGERATKKDKPRYEGEWRDVAIGAGLIVAVIAAALGTLFALVYLVVLAVRLAWGT